MLHVVGPTARPFPSLTISLTFLNAARLIMAKGGHSSRSTDYRDIELAEEVIACATCAMMTMQLSSCH